MATLRTRASKGSALTHNELDANFVRTITQKTDSYQILISDNRSIIEANKATATTMTLPPVATADNSETGDFEVTVTNIGAGISTVDGSGAEAVDGGTGVTLKQWDSVTCQLDSAQTGWKTISRVGDLGDIDAGAITATTLAATDDVTLTNLGTGSPILILSGFANQGSPMATINFFNEDATGPGPNNAAAIKSLASGAGGQGANLAFYTGPEGASEGAEPTLAFTLDSSQDATFAGNVVGVTYTATGDTSSGDNATMGYSATGGLVLTGQGSVNDVSIRNDAGIDAIEIPTGTTNVEIAGALTVGGVDGVLGGSTPAAATVTDLTASGDFTYDSIVQPKVKIVEIGDWDMDTTLNVVVAHGLTVTDIRSASAMIRNDADTNYYDFIGNQNTATAFSFDGTNIGLQRQSSGFFDGTDFDSTSFNRGWVTITYV